MPARFKVAIGVILVAAFFVAAAGWNLLTRIDDQSTTTARTTTALQEAERLRQCTAKDTTAAFATTLDLLADNFATPPYPDPARKQAVEGLRATADVFRAAKTPACPPRPH